MAPDPGELIAAIYNAAWEVRRRSRGSRFSAHSPLYAARLEAIRNLGLAVREAFSKLDDFEAPLIALYDGLSPKEPPPF